MSFQKIQSKLVPKTVKFPSKLRFQAMKLVEKGYFKNFSDIAVTGVRKVVEEHSPNSSALQVKELRKEWEAELLEKAKGNNHKAFELLKKELEKEAEKDIYKNITV